MGDHRASIKIEMEFHGVKDTCDMWINYYPHECCGMDKRVIEFFKRIYDEGMDKYNAIVHESEKVEREKAEQKRELDELKRLKEKYENTRAEGRE